MTIFHSPSVQAPAAWDKANLTVPGMLSRLGDLGYRYKIHPSETAGGLAGLVTFGWDVLDTRRYGASGGASLATNLIALNRAIAAAQNWTGGGALVVVPHDCQYGYKVADLTTHPQLSGNVPITVVDYSAGSSYAGFPNSYDGAQARFFYYTPATPRTATFTGGLLTGATSATLSANWSGNSSSGGAVAVWAVTFSNGDVRNVTLTNGATTATWAGGLSSNVTNTFSYPETFHDGNGQRIVGPWAPYLWIDNASGIANPSTGGIDNRRANVFFGNDGIGTWGIGQGTASGSGLTIDQLSNFNLTCFSANFPLTFTGALLLGATSATLASAWLYPTGTYSVNFSDGDLRTVTLTNGATTATWAGGLSGGATASATWQNTYIPWLVERDNGNIGFGIGTNTPQASYWFRSVSPGFAQAYFENPFTTTTTVLLRTSNGATDDAGIINRAGQLCLNISGQGDGLSIDKANRRATFGASMQQVGNVIAYSANMTPDATVANAFVITATNATAFSIGPPAGTPTQAMRISITIRNNSGGVLGVATWSGAVNGYKMAAWTQPANGFSRTIDFRYDVPSGFWVEAGRTTVDIPN